MEIEKSVGESWWELLTEEDKQRMQEENKAWAATLTDMERSQIVVWHRISTGSSE